VRVSQLQTVYHVAMQALHIRHQDATSLLRQGLLALQRGWFTLKLGALVLVLALSPSSYTAAHWRTLAAHIHTSTWQVLGWFTALAALLSLVLIRIVVVTALSYGLSQYALQMVVRVLVLELIPLYAALFVALRIGLATGGRRHSTAPPLRHIRELDMSQLVTQLTPRALADAFAVLTLAMVSSALVLVLSYLSLHGLSPWGLPGFTRTVGQVFNLQVSLGLILKVLMFSWTVAIVPMAASLLAPGGSGRMQAGSSALFACLFFLEAGSLAIKYI
jgi:phospholipid/cholesterol/gamma-HCH transport system permease protein